MSDEQTAAGSGTAGAAPPIGAPGSNGSPAGPSGGPDAAAVTAALPIPDSARGAVPPGAPVRSGSFALPDAARDDAQPPSTSEQRSAYGWPAPPPRPEPASSPAPPAAPPTVEPPRRRAGTRATGPRRAQLSLQRVDPWSVLKVSFLLSLLLAVVLLVATLVLYGVLTALGVVSAVDRLGGELGLDGASLLSLSNVLGVAALVALVDVILVTVLSTLYAYLYNACAALTGGVSVTLAERD